MKKERILRQTIEEEIIRIEMLCQDVGDPDMDASDIEDVKKDFSRAIQAEKKLKSIIVEIADTDQEFSSPDFREWQTERIARSIEKFNYSVKKLFLAEEPANKG